MKLTKKQVLSLVLPLLVVATSVAAGEWTGINSEKNGMVSLLSDDGKAMLNIICDPRECNFNILSQVKNERGERQGITITAEGHPSLKYSGSGQGYMPFWKAYGLSLASSEFAALLVAGDVTFEMKIKKSAFKSEKYQFLSIGLNGAMAEAFVW